MELFPYSGTWITCGAYAFLNAAGLDMKHLISVENSAGATFGIACMQEKWRYTRILTPVCDFNCGIDEAAYLWGFDLAHFVVDKMDEYLDFEKSVSIPQRLIVGPVNMSALRYLPLSQQYTCSDHYVALFKIDMGDYTITDSEGVPMIAVSEEELKRILTGKGIPESGGKLHIRLFRSSGSMPSVAERIGFTLKKAKSNLEYALKIHQGPNAFIKCRNVMERDPVVKWKESLCYSLDHFIQRRFMMESLIEDVRTMTSVLVENRLDELISMQVDMALTAKEFLYENDIRSAAKQMDYLSVTEEELTVRFGKWVHYDWNQ